MNKNGKPINCEQCGKEFYAAQWALDLGRRFCSRDCYHKASIGRSAWNKGIKRWWLSPTEFKPGQMSGEKNPNWKGGITKDEERFKEEYKKWRQTVFERDNFTCVWCGAIGDELEADHIYPQAFFPEKRYDINNGRTLCKECHKHTYTYLNPYLDTGFLSTTTGYFSLLINELPVDEIGDNKKEYLMWNDGSVECETGEFLMSLVRLIKPKEILETGTYKGWSSAYMATGLKENGFGHLTTLEFQPDHLDTSKKLWEILNVSSFITSYLVDAGKFTPQEGIKYQLILLDTEPQTRFAEAVRFFDSLDEGGFMFIHDLHRHMGQEDSINPDHPNEKHWPWGELPQELKDLVAQGKLRPIHFPTPRGLTGLYKTHSNDYKW